MVELSHNAAMTTVSTIRTWGEMIKFSHSVFALPFALIATFLAGRHLTDGLPTWTQLALILICMVSARSFAMTFNRIADAAIDARNPRTANRPIQAGKISLPQAWMFLIIAALVFFAACVGFRILCANPWPMFLGCPTLVCLAAYSYAKRFTPLAHFALGTAIAMAPVAAWIAIHPGSLGLPALLLTGIVLFWIAGFDIVYACQDRKVDRRDGLFSIPASLGVTRALLIAKSCHILSVGMLVGLGFRTDLGLIYQSAAAVIGILVMVEIWSVRPNNLSKVHASFFQYNGLAGLLLGIATICDILLLGD